jgi:electron transfer flavoprotein alpha subunit
MKQVPVPSQMRMGSDGLMDRTKAKSIINVDCSYALEEALQIKNHVKDAELIVVSMGPPSFEQSLRKAISMGFDRAVLLTDRRLGGSDTYATGLSLANLLKTLGFTKDSKEPFIVFAGRQTSDGDTAHVPSQVAENLGIPQATFIEKVEYKGDHLVVQRIIEGGYQKLKLPLPCVVSIAPTAIPPRRPSLGSAIRAKKAAIPRYDLTQVSVDPAKVGLDGSPTLVSRVVDIERHRPQVTMVTGHSASESTENLIQKIKETPAASHEAAQTPTPSTPAAEKKDEGFERVDFRKGASGVLTWVEMHGTAPARSSLEILSQARRLADQLKTQVVSVVIGKNIKASANQIIAHGADEVITIDDPRLEEYRILPFVRIISQIIDKHRPEIALFAATTSGRELAPRIASRVYAGVTADCTSLEVGEYTLRRKKMIMYPCLESIRPTYGESKLATIIGFCCPQMATARPGTFQPLPADPKRKGKITEFKPTFESGDFAAEIIETFREEGGAQNLFTADIIIAGGRPCGELDNFKLIQELTQALIEKGIKAEWGASRQAVDNGYAPYSRQIGQTGKTVRPKVYVALAISGAIQHVMGIKESGCIVAIDQDPHANIFKTADFGIVGDYLEAVPELIEKVKNGFTFGI